MIKINHLKDLVLVTSKENKLKEFQRYGISDLKMEKGLDLQEVQSDEITVVLHKAKTAGKNRIVEDTSLHIEGENVGVNVKWMLDNIHEFAGKSAYWEVLIGLNDGDSIRIYRGRTYGTIVKNEEFLDESIFGFDANFRVKGIGKTLHELEKEGIKDNHSARKDATFELCNNNYFYSVDIANISEWPGQYQNS
ncbi:dITP/XTP pyrophosphatase [compost metagenome]